MRAAGVFSLNRKARARSSPPAIPSLRTIGRLLDGTIFNQKRRRVHFYHFRVGVRPRQIIGGREVALPHLRDGGTYLVAIPSVLGYRERGCSS